MPTEYTLENNLSRTVEELIADTKLDAGTGRDLGALREHEIRVTPVLSTREGEGEVAKAKGRPVSVRKVTDLEKALAPNIGDFLLVVDAGTYDAASEHQQRAMLYDALLLIEITTGKNGAIKMGKRPPDLIMNSETIRVFGLCDAQTLSIADSVRHARKHAHLLMPGETVEEEEAPKPKKGKAKSKSKPADDEPEAEDDVDVSTEEEPDDDPKASEVEPDENEDGDAQDEDESADKEEEEEEDDEDEAAVNKPVKRRRG